MKVKKLIRTGIKKYLKDNEFEVIEDQEELNKLYALKVLEELAEIQASNHKDIMEFIDLIHVAIYFARVNGFSHDEITEAGISKLGEKGYFKDLVLTNLNPDNPSNKLYFKNE